MPTIPRLPLCAAALLAACAAPSAEPGGRGASTDSLPAAEAAVPPSPSERRGTLVVLSRGTSTALLLDAADGRVLATLPTGPEPHEVAVSPDGRRALVADYGGPASPGHTLTLLDLAGRRVEATIDVAPHVRPHGIAWLGGGRAAVTAEQSGAVLVVDVDGRRVEAVVPTRSGAPHMLAASPDGRRVYTGDVASGTATAVDLAAGTAVSARVGPGAEGVALSPDGRELWAADRARGAILVLDAATMEPRGTVAVPGMPFRLAFTPDGATVAVTLARAGAVALVDAASRREAARVAVGPGAPLAVAVSPDGRWAYVSHMGAPSVSVLDLARRAVAARIGVGPGPDGLALSPLSPP